MKAKRITAIILSCIFAVLTVAYSVKIIANYDKKEVDEVNDNLKIDVTFTGVSLANINTSNSKLKSEDDISNAVISWVEQIERLTDNNDWYKVYGSDIDTCNIYIKFDKNMQAGAMLEDQKLKLGNSISVTIDVNVNMFEGFGSMQLAHELTHLICGESFSRTLGEGLADYISRSIDNTSNCTDTMLTCASADEYMLNYYMPDTRKKLSEEQFQSFKLFEKNTIDGMLNVTTTYPYNPTDPKESNKFAVWHMYVESFTTYLIKKYGWDQFMVMFKQAKSIDDYKILNTEGGMALVEEWKKNTEWLSR